MKTGTIAILFAGALAAQTLDLRAVIGPVSKGDGGPAVKALLDGPVSIAADAAGNVYIAESNVGVIRHVLTDGTIERFAGTGTLADGTQGTAALNTDLISPTAVFVDANGSLLFADSGACRIRRVDLDGLVRDVIGTGRCAGAAGGGFPGRPGGGGSSTARLALETDLGSVAAIIVDANGLIVFSEESSHRVLRLDSDGYVRAIAGTGSAAFSGDGSAATSAALNSPSGLALDPGGYLFIADGRNCRVRRIDADGFISTVVGRETCAFRAPNFSGGTPSRTAIGQVRGIAYDGETNSLYIASPDMSRLLRADFNSNRLSSVMGNGTLGVPDFAKFPNQLIANEPAGVAVVPGLGVLTTAYSSFQIYQLQNNQATLFAGKWPEPGDLLRPGATCIRPDGALLALDVGVERIWRVDPLTAEITKYAGADYPTGFTSGDGGPATQASIGSPKRLYCAATGEVYLTHGAQIRVIDNQGNIKSARASVGDAYGVTVDAAGRLIYTLGSQVIRWDAPARTATVIAGTTAAGFSGDGGLATDAQLNSPGDLLFDSAGNLLIADRANHRVRRIRASDSKIETIAGSSRGYSYTDISGNNVADVGLDRITGIALDDQGNLFIAESARLSMVSPSGTVTLLLGYAGEDDAGTKSYRVGPISGLDGLSTPGGGTLYSALRSYQSVLSMRVH